jgi:hypothetical protein
VRPFGPPPGMRQGPLAQPFHPYYNQFMHQMAYTQQPYVQMTTTAAELKENVPTNTVAPPKNYGPEKTSEAVAIALKAVETCVTGMASTEDTDEDWLTESATPVEEEVEELQYDSVPGCDSVARFQPVAATAGVEPQSDMDIGTPRQEVTKERDFKTEDRTSTAKNGFKDHSVDQPQTEVELGTLEQAKASTHAQKIKVEDDISKEKVGLNDQSIEQDVSVSSSNLLSHPEVEIAIPEPMEGSDSAHKQEIKAADRISIEIRGWADVGLRMHLPRQESNMAIGNSKETGPVEPTIYPESQKISTKIGNNSQRVVSSGILYPPKTMSKPEIKTLSTEKMDLAGQGIERQNVSRIETPIRKHKSESQLASRALDGNGVQTPRASPGLGIGSDESRAGTITLVSSK